MAQGGACGGGIESAQGDTGDGQLVGGLQGRGQDVGIEGFELLLGVVEPADQQQTVNRQVASVGGVHGIAVALQGPASDSAVGLGVSFPTRYGDPMSLKHVTSVLRSEAQRLGAAIQDPLWQDPLWS